MPDLVKLAADVAKMRGYVGTYLAVLAKGALTAHQAESLAIDLKTLDVDLAALGAALALPAPTGNPADGASGGAPTPAPVDINSTPVTSDPPSSPFPFISQTTGVNVAALIAEITAGGFDNAAGQPDPAKLPNLPLDLKRRACAAGIYGTPNAPVSGGDYSQFTGIVGVDNDYALVYRGGVLVAKTYLQGRSLQAIYGVSIR